MRKSTQVYYAYKQPGLPDSEFVSQAAIPVSEALLHIAAIVARDPMRGSHMEFRIATDKDKVKFARDGNVPDADFASALESMVFGDE